MTKVKGVLFDLDGVLIDSETQYTAFWSDIEKVYPTGIPDYPMAIKGTTLSKILENYPDDGTRQDIIDRIHRFEDIIRYHEYPGVSSFLSDLKSHGIATAIVTSSDSVKMGYLFEQLPGLRQWFDTIVDGSMVTHSKPDPEPYAKGAEILGLRPEECVVFEDSFQGIASGISAGCHVIGVTTTFSPDKMKSHVPVSIGGFEDMTYDKMIGLIDSNKP